MTTWASSSSFPFAPATGLFLLPPGQPGFFLLPLHPLCGRAPCKPALPIWVPDSSLLGYLCVSVSMNSLVAEIEAQALCNLYAGHSARHLVGPARLSVEIRPRENMTEP